MKYIVLVLMLCGCAQQGGSRQGEAIRNPLADAARIWEPAVPYPGGVVAVPHYQDQACMIDCTKRYSWAYCQRVCEY